MKKRILVPVDFSGDSINALEHAIFIANNIDADVRMIHVMATKNFDVPFYFKEIDQFVGKTADQFFKILMDKYEPQVKNTLDYKVRKGKIYEEITNQAKYGEAYLIMMGTHGASGFEEFWAGSNAYRVVVNSSIPVITIRHGVLTRRMKRIVLPIDETKDTKNKVPMTTELAGFFGAELHVVSVCESDEKDVKARLASSVKQVKEYIESKHQKCITDELSGQNITEMIIDYAKKIDADLIAIMSTQPSSPKNFWMGAYSQQMVNHSPIPVLTMNPEDE